MSASTLMERFREGQRLSRQRRYAEAETAFRDCLAMRPSDLPARNQLASVLSRTGRFEEAERELKKSLEQDPTSLQTLSQLGACYERAGKKREAEEAFRRCRELDPKDRAAALQLAKLLMERGALEEAERTLRETLGEDNLGQREVPLLCQLGILLAKQGQASEAEACFRQCLRIDRENIPARHQLGMLYARRNQAAKAEKLFLECIALDSRQYQAHHQLGMLYAREDRPAEAERMFRACIALDDRKPAAYQHLGALYAKQGRDAEAERMFAACLARGRSPEAASSLAVFKANHGEAEEARRLIEAMPKGDARNRSRLMCATGLAKAGHPREAILFLERILADEPGNVPALHQKGSILLMEGDAPAAERCFRAILAHDAKNAAALHSLAELAIEQGEVEEGVRLLERIAAESEGHYLREKLSWIKGESYDPSLVWREIHRHMQDDTARRTHGVFHMDALEINQAIAQCIALGSFERRGMTRRYIYPWPGAGHAGGREGDGHIHDAIAVITYWDGERIINAYPCDLPYEKRLAAAQ